MREDILLMLNEREPLKKERANELELQCQLLGLCCTRLQPSADTIDIIQTRCPKILVLDYILGDFGTALEVLQSLNCNQTLAPIQVLLWTDELSITATVSAMKLGALDYIEISTPRSVERIVAVIESAISSSEAVGLALSNPRLTRSSDAELIFQSPESHQILNQARTCAKRNQQVVLIQGPPGIGRSALARFIHSQRSKPGILHQVDLDTWNGSTVDIFGDRKSKIPRHLLSSAATVVVDHLEYDPTEFINAVEVNRGQIWEEDPEEKSIFSDDKPMLILATASSEVAKVCRRVLKANVIELPGLAQRGLDFLPIIQQLANNLSSSAENIKFSPSAPLISYLQTLEWPGNIKQLLAVLTDALCSNSFESTSQALKGGGEFTLENAGSLSLPEQSILREILTVKSRWERFANVQPYVPEAFAAMAALAKYGGCQRLAAAALGTGVAQIRTAVGYQEVSQTS